MTERQLLLLHEAEMRRQRRARAATLLDMNMAFNGGDSANKHYKSLIK
jgi:hypothetical protein